MQMVPKCSACNSAISGRRFAEIGTAVFTKENVDGWTEFLEHAGGRQWADLRRFQEFKGDRDDLVAIVLACDEGGSLIMVRSVFELFSADELVVLNAITPNDIGTLRTLIASDHWHRIDD
jgi:hypothetical protein